MQRNYWPTTEWQIADPADLGKETEKLTSTTKISLAPAAFTACNNNNPIGPAPNIAAESPSINWL